MTSTVIGHRRTLAGGLVACVLAAGVPAVLGKSVNPTSVDFVGGTAWLVSEAQNEIVRINGASGKLDASVPVDEVGSAVGSVVSQEQNTVLVDVGGEIRGLDLANLNWGAGTASASPDSSLVVGDGLAWLVAPDGVVRELNPVTLRERGKLDLGGTPGHAVVSEDNLVVPLDDGTVRVIDGHEQIAKLEVGRPTDQVHITALGKRVVALNQTVGRVFRVDAERGKVLGKADVDLPEGELGVPTELPRGPLWVLARRTGDLVRVSTQTGEVEAMRTEGSMVTPRGDVLGPASADDTIYLVDRSKREVVLFNTVTRQRGSRAFPDSITDPSRVELVVEGGYVYVNDVAGSAVTVFNNGKATDLNKYENDGVPGSDPPPPSDEPPPPGQNPPPSGPGEPVPPPPPATEPPAAPTEVNAVAGNASATVSWTHGAGTTPPTVYYVTYEGRRGGPIEVAGDTSSVSISDLRNGESYAFEVWAANDYGESDRVRSNTVKPNDEVPGTPSNVTATPGNADARVSWDAADGRGNDITSYSVTAQPGGRTATVDGRTTSATVDGLVNDTAYTFTVVAVNDRGIQGQASSPSAAVTPYGPPSPLANLRASSDDGSVALSWNASTSQTAVTYVVVSNRPVGGRTQWTTTETDWSLSGLTNGVAYTFTVTPRNDHGDGVSRDAYVTPGRAATISNVVATRTGERQFEVSFNYDAGGLPLTACEVSGDGGVHQADCSGGAGSVTIGVGMYFTDYTFTARVANERNGSAASGSASGTSATKPFTIRSDGSAFDGSCTWEPDAGGRPNTRPYFANARHTCPMWDPPGDRPIGYLPLGTTVQGECHTQGDEVRDDNLVTTTTWIRVAGRGWMPSIYFTNYQSNPTAGLPAC